MADRYGPLALVVHAAGVVASAAVAPLRAADPRPYGPTPAPRSARPWPCAPRCGGSRGPAARHGAADVVGDGVRRRPGARPYAAANRFLDALAEREHAADSTGEAGGTRWISVAWDGWRVGPGGGERVVASRHSIGLRDGMRSVDRLLALAAHGRAPPRSPSPRPTWRHVRRARRPPPRPDHTPDDTRDRPASAVLRTPRRATPPRRPWLPSGRSCWGSRSTTATPTSSPSAGTRSWPPACSPASATSTVPGTSASRTCWPALGGRAGAALAEPARARPNRLRARPNRPAPGRTGSAPGRTRPRPAEQDDGPAEFPSPAYSTPTGSADRAATASGTYRARSTWSTTARGWTSHATRPRGTGSSPGTRCCAR
ncbi:hypothetical protein NKH77_04405 [Streptomyces sp. M19]